MAAVLHASDQKEVEDIGLQGGGKKQLMDVVAVGRARRWDVVRCFG